MRDPHRRIILGTLLTLAVVVTIASRARAGNGCCAHCGCAEGCQKICRLVCETKKVITVCWGCQSEDFCVPGRSTPNGKQCEMVCEECADPKAPSVQPKKFVWTEWIPSGTAKVYTRHKLMKRTITKTVPSYKWVVEDLCPQCEANSPSVDVPPGTNIPPAPAVMDAKSK